jgi:hypothetical protein
VKRWLSTLALASDIAVVGFAVTLFAMPLVTAAAALRTGSVAVHALAVDSRKVTFAELVRVFVRSLLPGLGFSVAFAASAVFLAFDFTLVRGERVPGGALMLGLLAVTGFGVLGVAGAALASLGVDAEGRWFPAVRCACGRPAQVAASGAVLAVAAAIALLIPFTTPLMLGCALFALQVLAARQRRRPANPVEDLAHDDVRWPVVHDA